MANTDVRPGDRSPTIVIEGERATKPKPLADTATSTKPERELAACVPLGDGWDCRLTAIAESDPALPAEIERAVREIGLPALTIQIQPGDQTLVNVPTIFHTQPAEFARTVTLLGQAVDVEATPSSYRWHHGDGTSSTTTGPGRPYPSTDVTHTYRQSGEGLRPSVDVTYRVRYRVNGGAWQDLSTPITATGPAATLRVTEAPPVLVHP